MPPFVGSLRHDTYRIDYHQLDGALPLLSGHAASPSGMEQAFFVTGAAALSAPALRALFEDAALYFAHDPLMQESGTTATIAHITTRGLLHLAYVGDSPAFIYCRQGRSLQANGRADSRGETRAETYALVAPHVPTDPAEGARIERAGGVVIDGYLDNNLALSRALGDRSTRGITYKPDCQTFDLAHYFRDGHEAAVVVRGEAESCTAMTLVLKEPPAEAITLALFAGHGRHGAAVSRNVADYMAAQMGGQCVGTMLAAAQSRRFRFLPGFLPLKRQGAKFL